MNLTEAHAKCKEVGGEVVGLCRVNAKGQPGGTFVQQCLPGQTTCDFYGVKVVTGAAGGHLFYTLLW
jgi:hypothetical protein